MDSLSLMLKRFVHVVAGAPGSGKSRSLVRLAQVLEPEGRRVKVIDRDRGLAEAVQDLCTDEDGTLNIPGNLDYVRVKEWQHLEDAVQDAVENYEAGEYVCVEHLGRVWDFAQTSYTKDTLGARHSDIMNTLREQAEDEIKKAAESGGIARTQNGRRKVVKPGDEDWNAAADSVRRRYLGFKGLDGRLDWPLIKALHNDNIFESLINDGDFNLISTTTWNPLSKDDVDRYPEWKQFGARPNGEKEQVARHSSVVGLYKRDMGGGKLEWMWRTDFGEASKDRGHELTKDVIFSGRSYLESYAEFHGEEL